MIGYILGTILLVLGILGVNDPNDNPETFHAQLVECYDFYDNHGDLTYRCDFRTTFDQSIVSRDYQRQAWREMQSGVGNLYVLTRPSTSNTASWFMIVGGLLSLFIGWICRVLD